MASIGQAAAILSVAVRADTAHASSELNRFNSGLTRTAHTARASTKQTDLLHRANNRVSSSLKSAAKYAIGAGAAYLSISQAKEAVQVTTDLASATTSLKKNFGVAIKSGSALSAIVSARGGEVSALANSFGTLSKQVVAARNGSDSTIKTFRGLGISMKDLRKLSLEDILAKSADGFKEMGSGASRSAAATKLFGKTGQKELIPILREGSGALREQLKEADKLGASFDNVSLKKAQDLMAAQKRMQLAVTGLKVAFGTALAPAITEATNKLADFAKILNNPNLSNDEKFSKIADQLTDIFSKALTKVTEEAGKRAPQVAGAFVKGFLAAPILGQLLLGAWLLNKIGALGGVGKAMGKKILAGIAETKIGAEILSMLPGPVQTTPQGTAAGRGWAVGFGTGVTLGVAALAGAVAATVNKYLGGFVADNVPDSSIFSEGAIQERFGRAKQAIAAAGPALASVGGTISKNFSNAFSGGLFKDLGEKIRNKLLSPFQELPGKVGDAVGAVQAKLGNLRDWISNAWKNVGDFIASPFKSAVEKIRGFINDIIGIINTVLGPIGVHIGEVGGDSGGTGAVGRGHGGRPGGAHAGQQRGGLIRAQQGVMVPGQGPGDKVPALLEPGEFVLNRKAVETIGASKIENLNKAIPRFQSGGGVQKFGIGGAVGAVVGKAKHFSEGTSGGFGLPGIGGLPGWLQPAGSFVLDKVGGFIKKKLASAVSGIGGDILNTKSGKSTLASLQKTHPELQEKITSVLAAVLANNSGLSITSTTGGGHVAGSLHYSGRAVDLGGSPGAMLSASEWVKSSGLYRELAEGIHNPNLSVDSGRIFQGAGPFGAVWADHVDHVHLAAQKGGLVQKLQGGGQVRYKEFLKHGAHWLHPHNPVNANEGATLLWQAGMSASDAAKLSTVLPDESSGRWNADNPSSDALGVWQILGRPTGGASGPLTDPIVNSIDAAIKWRTEGPGAWPTYPGSGPAGKILSNLVGSGSTAPLKGKSKAPSAAPAAWAPVIPPKFLEAIARFSGDSGLIATADNFAQRASSLGIPVGGLDEVGWLKEELQRLAEYRAVLIAAVEWLNRIIQNFQDAIAKAKNEIAELKKGQMTPAKKAQVKALQAQIDKWTTRRDATHGVLFSEDGMMSKLSELQDPLTDAAIQFQNVNLGLDGGYLGVFGGTIGDVQSALKSAQDQGLDVGNTSTESADLLKGLLAQANQRTAVGAAQFGVLKDLKYLPTFAKGGFLAGGMLGIAGERGPELIQGPARVFSNSDSTQMASSNVEVLVRDQRTHVLVDGKEVRATVKDETRKQGRKLDRRLGGI